MTHTTVLSVRGDAALIVTPDEAGVSCEIRTHATDKATALDTAATALEAVVADLGRLGGRVLASDGERVPLGWVASSVTSYPQTRWDEGAGEERETGRVVAVVDVTIRVRDFALLDRLGDALAGHETFHVQHTAWTVDDDNAAWPTVRAAAIAAALQKGRDYAAALGGSLTSIDQIADAGLLGGDGYVGQGSVAAMAATERALSVSAPSLTPVPQRLTAVVEARLSASIADLAGDGPHGGKRVTP
jgi:hypothetical protein